MRDRSHTLAVTAALFAACASARPAHADEKAACVAASEEAQQLRTEGKLRVARERLLSCARDVCPAIVRKDCSDWLGEVDRSLPSVVASAKDAAGHDVVDAKLFLDGQLVASSLDGRALPVDPGAHTLRFDGADGTSSEQRVVVREGERNRAVLVTLAKAEATSVATETTLPPATTSHHKAPVAAYVLGGVGLVAIGSFAFFGLSGRAAVSNLRATCAPNCGDPAVNSAHAKLIVADASLGVGIVSLGIATYLFFSGHDSDASSSAHLDVTPLAGGGVARFVGRF